MRLGFLIVWLIVLSVSAIAFGAFVVPTVRGRARADVSRDLGVLADVSATAIESWCRDAMADTRTVAGFPTSRVLVSPRPEYEPDPRFQQILDEFARLHDATGLVLIDRRQVEHAATTHRPAAGPDVQRFVAAVLASGRDSLELVSMGGERWVALVAAHTPGHAGVVLAEYDPALWLYRMIASAPAGLARADAVLLRREGNELLAISPVHEEALVFASRRSLAAGSGTGATRVEPGDGFAEVRDESGRLMMTRSRSLRDRRWVLVTGMRSSDALGRVNRGLRVMGGIAALALTALTALAFALVWGLRRAHEADTVRNLERLAVLLDQANEAMGYASPDGIIRHANRSAEAFGGFPDGLVGRSLFATLLPPASGPSPMQARDRLAHEGRATYETEATTAAGERVPLEASLREVLLNGEALWVFVARDLTARREAEARIRRLNRLLRATSAMSSAFLHVHDEHELYVRACQLAVDPGGFRLACLVLGRPEGPFTLAHVQRDPAPGRIEPPPRLDPDFAERSPSAEAIRAGRSIRIADVQALESPPRWRQLALAERVHSCGSSPIVVHGEVRGAFTLFAAEADAFDDEAMSLIDGTVAELGAALGAIETRRERERLEQRLGALFVAGPVGFVVADGAGIVTHANAELLRIAARTESELRAGRIVWSQVCPRPTAGAAGDAPRRVSERHGGAEECEVFRPDGSRIPVLVGEVCMAEPAGETVAIVSDLTRQHEAAESLRQTQLQLLQAQKMETIGQLAGGVAHDFNNLLTVIHGYADLLRISLPPGSEADGHVQQVLRAADRASSLTRQLLAFSRRQVLDPRVVDLKRLVSEVEDMLRRLIGSRIQLECLVPDSVGRVLADSGQIEQVIVNLVVNARDAMPEGGRVRIELGDHVVGASEAERRPPLLPGPYVRLAIADEGPGIPPEVMPHIFEPFFTTKGEGTGLGLATVYGIVKQSGGYIFVESPGGSGARFEVLLPRFDDLAAMLPANSAKDARQPPDGTRLAPGSTPS